MTPLISTDELAKQLESDRAPALLDVRWSFGGPPGRPLYLEGHIPGAVYVDLDTELSTSTGDLRDGRSPMPSIETLTAAARRWGVQAGGSVVVYDDVQGMAAGRAWWLLRHAGLDDVRLLEGGLRAWRDASLPLEPGGVTPEPSDVELAYGSLDILDIDGAAALARDGVLLDARPPTAYTGEVEKLEPRGGHIPGALLASAGDHLDESGNFRSVEEMRAYYAERGVRPGTRIGVYCGGGVSCAVNAIALTMAGYTPAIYPGSWSQWASNTDRPAATGTEPG